MPSKDPEKRRAAVRRWYVRHKDEHIERVKSRGRVINAEVKQLKESQPCLDCGKSYPHYVMDFDHVRGEKRANIADMINRSCSRKAVFDEIAKCDLVCSNCHRVRTHTRRAAG